MSTAPQMQAETQAQTHPDQHDQGAHADDFAALEERVLRMVDLVRTERRERQKADETAAALQQLLDEQSGHLERAHEELRSLGREREQVRGRVERLLQQLDELGS